MLLSAPILLPSGHLRAQELEATEDQAQRLAYHRSADVRIVGVVIASVEGRNREAAAAVKAAGGRIVYRNDLVDYLHAAVPVERFAELARNSAIAAANVDSVGEPATHPVASSDDAPEANVHPSAPPVSFDDKLFSNTRPYDRDLDADEFHREHPTFDGRGAVVAVLEYFPDFLAPELQTARDLAGHPLPKFLDVIGTPSTSLVDPKPSGAGDFWASLGSEIGSGRQKYRLGTLEITGATATLLKRFSPDLAKQRGPVKLPVQWSETDQAVRIDMDGDGDFQEEQPVGEFSRTHTFGVFGKDDPGTSQRESVAYALQKDGNRLGFDFGAMAHTTSVAATVAGSLGERGRIEGVAPGAQLIALRSGAGLADMARSFIVAFTDPRVDVVLSMLTYPSFSPATKSAQPPVVQLLLRRLISRYPKPTAWPASNFPGVASAYDPGTSDVLTAGAVQSRETTLASAGILMAGTWGSHWVGGEGPAVDGGMMPDVVAPAFIIAATNGFSDGAALAGVYRLPPGYRVFGGTSQAGPVTAGAMALLVSAAKQSGLPRDARSIARALRDSGRFIPGMHAFQQGAGVISIARAWQRLHEIAAERDPLKIEVQAPVHTARDDLLPHPGLGRGIFDQEGWRAGMADVRLVRLIRKNGGRSPVRVDLAWVGNQENFFSTSETLDLPLNEAVDLPVRIGPTPLGVHSAILEVRASGTRGVAARVPVTVVAPYEPGPENGYSVDIPFQIARIARDYSFFRVPEMAESLRIEYRQSSALCMNGLIATPEGRVTPDWGQSISGGDGMSVILPSAGVWQASLMDWTSKTFFDPLSAADVNRVVKGTLRAMIKGASVTAAEGGRFEIRNLGAPIYGGVETSALGVVRRITGTLAGYEQRVFDVDVEAGSEALLADVRADADVDIYLFDCTTGTCASIPSQQGNSLRLHERVWLDRPTAGRWRVVIGMGDARGRGANFQYTQVLTHPRYGALISDGGPMKRASGETWSTTLRVSTGTAAGKGESIVALVYVRDQSLPQMYARPACYYAAQHGFLDPAPSFPLGLQVVEVDQLPRDR
ncbi:MAG: S8 family serine peptidase [Gammaproteobacteria bacterium]